MKHKIVLVLLAAVLALTCAVTVNAATIKEDTSTYAGNGDVYIIGSSKFTNNIVITGKMIGVAGAIETVIQYMIYNNYDFDPDDLQIYYYNDLTKTWKELPETSEDTIRNLTEAETEALTNDLRVYYENQEEKTLEIPYEVTAKEGYNLVVYAYDNQGNETKVEYKDGKLQVPATSSYIKIELVNEQDENDKMEIETLSKNSETLTFESKATVVNNLKELKEAIANKKEYIMLNADITNITETITIPYAVKLNGAGYRLAFKNIQKTSTSEVASGIVISGKDVSSFIENIIIEMDSKEGWQGNYGMQVYDSDAYIENYTATGCDAALLVNGSYVTLAGTINVTGNEFGGIEVSKGSNTNLQNSTLFLNSATVVMEDESAMKPFAWLEKNQGEIINGLYVNQAIPDALGKTTQTYYYSSEDAYKTAQVSTYNELKAAFTVSNIESVKLLDDITLDAILVVNKKVTLDLNGHTINNEVDLWNTQNEVKYWSLISVRNGGNLTVTGNGTMKAKENDCYAIDLQEGGIVTIENGTFIGNISAVYVKEGDLTVNGGTYSIQQLPNDTKDERYTLNCLDANYQARIARITVKGGTFAKYNPAANLAEISGADFVPDGYKVVENGDNYTVEIDS